MARLPRRRECVCAGALAMAAWLGGCASERAAAPAVADAGRPAPAYEEVAARYNERASRLERLWARAVVELRWKENDGKKRWEQGDGALQRLAPDRFSLSVNKLGERIALVGCDAERFWLFEFGEPTLVSVALNQNAASPCCDRTGLAASPLDIVDMLGVLPMPTGEAARRANAAVGWTPRGDDLRVEFDVRSGRMRIEYPPGGVGPSRIALLVREAGGFREALVARLDSYEPVTILGEGTVRPRLASRIFITDPAAGSEVRLGLTDMSSGRPEQLSDAAFDLEALLDVFGPVRLIVLDRRCERSAFPMKGG